MGSIEGRTLLEKILGLPWDSRASLPSMPVVGVLPLLGVRMPSEGSDAPCWDVVKVKL